MFDLRGLPGRVARIGWASASLLLACKREDSPPPQPPPASWATATPTATAAPLAPQPTSPQPAAYAPTCEQPEGTCGWARCNMTARRCSWPCGSDADCITGARCVGPAGLSQCIGNLSGSPR